MMRFMIRALTAVQVGILALASFQARAEPFTPAQRAEIVDIVRDAMKRDPTILRDAVVALQADDGEHEKAAARQALVASKDSLVGSGDPVGGNPRGDVTIVEFFDVRCPYCRKMEQDMASFLSADRNVRLVYKDLPILGAASVLGSKALLAARNQNAYEKLRDVIMSSPRDITREAVEVQARKLGLDSSRLLHDMDDPAIQTQIDANLRLAHRLNIQGTPALIIGGEILPGAVDVAELKRAVAEARTVK